MLIFKLFEKARQINWRPSITPETVAIIIVLCYSMVKLMWW